MVTANDGTSTSPAASLAIVITATNDAPTAVDDSFGISSDHTRTVTLSGNVITGVAGTGLTTEGGATTLATDIMLGADMDDGGVSNLRVTFVSNALNDGSLDLDESQAPGPTGTTVTFLSGQGTLTINETGAFTYTPPTGDFEFFFSGTKRAIAAGETGTIRVAYRIADMASPAEPDDGVLTITVTAPAANTPPRLAEVMTPMPDKEVTEDAAANDTAGGSFMVADDEQTGANAVTVQRCVDAVMGTACTAFANAAAGNIGGIYGNFTLTNAGVWEYTLDNQCGTTPGIQGTTTDAGETGDPGCATDALAGDENPAPTDVLRIRADDGTADATTAAGTGTSRYSATEVVTITITGVNDKPTLNLATNLTVSEDVMSGGSAGRTFALTDFGWADAEDTSTIVGLDIPPVIVEGGVATTTPAGNFFNEEGEVVPGPRQRYLVTRAIIPQVSFAPVNRSANYTARFVVTPSDSDGLFGDPGNLDIMVTADNDAPTVVGTGNRPAVAPGTSGAAYSQPLAGFFEDVDTDQTLTYALSGTCTGFVVSGNNLVGSGASGIIPTTVTTDTTCMVTATDGTATSPPASLAIDITATNALPVVSITAFPDATLMPGSAFRFTLTRSDASGILTMGYRFQRTGGGATPLDVSDVTSVSNGVADREIALPGSLVIAGATYTVTVTEMDSYTVGAGDAGMRSVTIPGPNAAPVATNDLVEITTADLRANGTYVYNVLTGIHGDGMVDPNNPAAGADSDGDAADMLVVTRVAPGSTLGSSPVSVPADGTTSGRTGSVSGQLAVLSGGSFTYRPTDPAVAVTGDVYTYEISDGTEVATATFTIRIALPANSKPVLARGSEDADVTEAGGVANAMAGDPSASGAFSSSDDDNDMLTLQARASANSAWTPVIADGTAIPGGVYGSLSVDTDGSWTYTLDNDCGSTADDPGCATEALNVRPPNTPLESDDFSFRLDDGNTGDANQYSDVLGLQVSITGANDAPAVAETLPTPDGGTSGMEYSMDLVQFFTDPDHASLTYGIKTGTCTGFEVSGNNLVGSDSGSIPTTVIADTPCTITATDNVVATPTETSFTIPVTLPAAGPNTPPTLAVTTMGTPDMTEDMAFILTLGNLTVGDTEQTANALTVQRCVDTAPGTVGAPGTACTNFSDTGSLIGTYGAFSLTETGWTYQLNNADPDTNALDETATGDARVRDVLRLRVDDGTADATTAAGTGTARYSMTQVVTITITGANDLPVPANTTTDGMVVEAGVNPANDLVTADNAAAGSVAVTDPDDAAFTYRVKHSTESSYVSAPASSSVDRDGTYGAITLNSTGAWTYTLDQMCGATAGIQGDTVDTAEAGDPGCATQMLLEASTGITDVFNIQVNDGTADGTTIADITITVDGTNDAPTLVVPQPTVTPGTVGQMYRLPLAQFFEDVDHDTHRYSIQGSTCGGFKVSGANLVGSDTTTEGAIPAGTAANSPVSCTIRAIDGEVGHVSASLSVTVAAVVNMDPTAVDDEYSISEDIDAANSGTQRVVFTAGNVITGDSNSANAGADEDSDGMVSDLRVTFYAGGDDIAAAIGNDEEATAAATFNTNLNASATTAVSGGAPPRLRVQMQTDGAFRLIMPADDSRYQALPAGTDAEEKFSYRVTDMGTPPGTDDGVLTVTITGANDAPVPSSINPVAVTAGGSILSTQFAEFTDPDGETATYTAPEATYAPADGSASSTMNRPAWLDFDATNRGFTGTAPATGADGVWTVPVIGADGGDPTVTVSTNFVLTVNAPGDDAPNAMDDPETGTIAITEHASNAVTGNVFTNDTGLTDTRDTRTLVGYSHGGTYDAANAITDNTGRSGTYGSLSIDASGGFSYEIDDTPVGAADRLRQGQTETDVFTYRVSDKASGSPYNDATITITVTGENDAPKVVTEIADTTLTLADTVSFMAAFSDVDADPLTYGMTCNPSCPSWLMLDATTGAFSNTGTLTRGVWQITVTASDQRSPTPGMAMDDFTLTVAVPSFSIAATSTMSTADPVIFTVTRSTPAVPNAVDVNIDITNADGYVTAQAQETLMFGMGMDSLPLSLPRASPNTKHDSDGDTITATLATDAAYDIGTAAATLAVIDIHPAFDLGQTPAVAQTTTTGAQAGGDITFRVNRIGSNTGALQLPVTVTTTETSRVDATDLGQVMVNFAEGDMSGDITVGLTGDARAGVAVTATMDAADTNNPTWIVGANNAATATVDAIDNTPPTLTPTSPDTDVTEDDNADNEADGSVAAMDGEETAIAVGGCADTTPGTDCTSFTAATGTGATFNGIYGAFTLTTATGGATWSYALDNDCGSMAGDPGCATDALDENATPSEVLRLRADDGTAATSGATSRYSSITEVSIAVQGANDVPVPVNTTSDGMVVEAGVNASNVAVTGDSAAAGSVAVTDPDDTSFTYQVKHAPEGAGGYATAPDGGSVDKNGTYGVLNLESDGTWTYALDQMCGTTPGIQGAGPGGDPTETGDPGCATEMLLRGSTGITDQFNIRVNDGTADSTAAADISITVTGNNDAPTEVASPPAADPGTEGQMYTLDLTDFFEDVDHDPATHTFTIGASTCGGFKVSGTDLVGSDTTTEGVIPAGTATNSPVSCTIRATDGESGHLDATFSITVGALSVVSITTFPDEIVMGVDPAVVFTRTSPLADALTVGYSVGKGSATTYNAVTFSATVATANATVGLGAPAAGDVGDIWAVTLLSPSDAATNSLTVGMYEIPGSGDGLTRSRTVLAPNMAPVAAGDPIAIGEDAEDLAVTARASGVLGNDTDEGVVTMLMVVGFQQVTNAATDYDPSGAVTAPASPLALNANGEKVADFTLNVNGTYTLALENSTLQSLGTGDTEVLHVRYRIEDDRGGVNLASNGLITITVNGANDKPEFGDAFATNLSITEDQTHSFAQGNFDYEDAEGGAYSIVFGSAPVIKDDTGTSAGHLSDATDSSDLMASDYPETVHFSALGNYAYNPVNRSSNYTAQFMVTPRDSANLDGDPATLEIMVTADNEAPTVATAIPNDAAIAMVSFDLDISTNFSDVDTDQTLTYSATYTLGSAAAAPVPAPGPSGFWLKLNSATGAFSGRPESSDVTNDLDIDVTASDGHTPTAGEVTDSFRLTVVAGNTRVTAANDAIAITEGGGSISFNVTTGPNSGTAGDSTAQDAGVGGGNDGTANVLGYVKGDQDASYPGAKTPTPASTGLKNGYGTLTIDANGAATYALDTQCGDMDGVQGSVDDPDEIGDFGCTPNALKAGQMVMDVFTYQVADKAATADPFTVTMDTAVITVTITGANNAPVLAVSGTPELNVTEAGATRAADNAAMGQFSITDFDTGAGVAGAMTDTHTATARTGGAGDSGTFAALPAGGLGGTYGTLTALVVDDAADTVSWTYALDQARAATNALGDETAMDVFTIRVNDGTGNSIAVTITVTVQGDNDAPTVSLSSTVDDAVTEAGGVGNGTNDNPTATGTVIAMDPDSTPEVNGCFGASCLLGNRNQGTRGSDSAMIGGTYGTLALKAPNASGEAEWTYTLNQDHADVEALDGGDTPDTPDTLTETFRFRAFDSAGEGSVSSGMAHIVMQEITITGANDAPVVGASPIADTTANAGVAFRHEITFGPARNFNDVDGADTALTYTLTTKPDWMNDIASGSNIITGSPMTGDVSATPVNVTVQASDSGGLSISDTFAVTVEAGNPSPVANDDMISVAEDTTAAVTQADDDGTYGDVGDLFSNDDGLNDTAFGDAPDAVLVGYVAGAYPSDGTTGVVAAGVGAMHANPDNFGTLTIDADGAFEYALNTARANDLQQGEEHAETYTYRISDRLATDSAHGTRVADGTITVVIGGLNDQPTATPEAIAQIQEDTDNAGDTSYTFTVTDLGFDDPDSEPAADTLNNITIAAAPLVRLEGGTDTSDSAGALMNTATSTAVGAGDDVAAASIPSLVFTPANRTAGYSAVIEYTVTDSSGASNATSDPVKLVIPVAADNDAPTGTDNNNLVTIGETATHAFDAADFGYDDPEGTPLGRVNISAATRGTLALDGSAYTFGGAITLAQLAADGLVFTPQNRSANYDATVTFTVSDGVNNSAAPNTLTIKVTAGEDNPEKVGDFNDLTLGSEAMIDGAAIGDADDVFRVVDVDDQLAYTFSCAKADVASSVAHPTCPRSDDGTTGFLSLSGGLFSGTTPFTAMPLSYTVTVTANGTTTASFTLNVQTGDIEPSPQPDAIAAVEDGAAVSVKTNGDDSVFDGDSGLAGHANDVRTLVGYSAGASYDAGTAITDGSAARGSAARGSYGSLTMDGTDGTFEYTVDDRANALQGGMTVMDQFTYRVSDKAAAHANHASRARNGVITVTVTGVNDAPEAAAATLTGIGEDEHPRLLDHGRRLQLHRC